MQEHKPFLNSNYSLKELAIDLQIPCTRHRHSLTKPPVNTSMTTSIANV
ncbi:hypothetical protein [Paraflavitalea speifideaquila]|nr:hypothetical protein [Paraflavitalea speifideiaquila]